MIIAAITSGLGNQMFQYAAARALSVRLGVPLKLETSWFRYSRDRSFQLNRFRIQATVMTPSEENYWKLLKSSKITRLVEAVRPLGLLGGLTPLVDKQQGFDERILSVNDPVYLNGYWQSEKYFNAIAGTIRDELTFVAEPDDVNRATLDKMKSSEAVVLHVRRGDYVSNAATTAHHGVCDLDYYQRAIQLMILKVSSPHFFIFSDDPEWSAQNLKLDYPSTYVTHNTGKQDHEDLRLMAAGKHFIIANSSFSWWGAWLSANRGKQVVAPGRWFNSPLVSSRDLLPEGWTVI